MLNKNTTEITFLLSDLVNVVIKMQEEQNRDPYNPKGAYITIYTTEDIETGEEKNEARFDLIECGGLGAISIDIIDEITEDQLWEIP